MLRLAADLEARTREVVAELDNLNRRRGEAPGTGRAPDTPEYRALKASLTTPKPPAKSVPRQAAATETETSSRENDR